MRTTLRKRVRRAITTPAGADFGRATYAPLTDLDDDELIAAAEQIQFAKATTTGTREMQHLNGLQVYCLMQLQTRRNQPF